MIEPPPPALGSFTPMYTPISFRGWNSLSQIAIDPTTSHRSTWATWDPRNRHNTSSDTGETCCHHLGWSWVEDLDLFAQLTWRKSDLDLLTLKENEVTLWFRIMISHLQKDQQKSPLKRKVEAENSYHSSQDLSREALGPQIEIEPLR